MIYLVWVVLIGILAGWLAGQITKGSGFGLLGDLIVGILGSLLGSFLFGLLGIFASGLPGPPGHGRDRRYRVAVADSVDQRRLSRVLKS
jgi:uncharacterized membrane protein YeaQ/YmgE (transglycosylase-associated protein family)